MSEMCSNRIRVHVISFINIHHILHRISSTLFARITIIIINIDNIPHVEQKRKKLPVTGTRLSCVELNVKKQFYSVSETVSEHLNCNISATIRIATLCVKIMCATHKRVLEWRVAGALAGFTIRGLWDMEYTQNECEQGKKNLTTEVRRVAKIANVDIGGEKKVLGPDHHGWLQRGSLWNVSLLLRENRQ